MGEKINHNKKTNVGIIFGIVSQKLLEMSMHRSEIIKNKENIVKVTKLINKYFRKGNPLHEELRVYSDLLKTKLNSKTLAEELVKKTLTNVKRFDSKKHSMLKKQLVNECYTIFGKDNFWAERLKDYRVYVAIGNLIEHNMGTRKLDTPNELLMEDTVCSYLNTPRLIEEKALNIDHEINDHVFLLAYKLFEKEDRDNLNDLQKETVDYYLLNAQCDPNNMKSYMLKSLREMKISIDTNIDLQLENSILSTHQPVVQEAIDLAKEHIFMLKKRIDESKTIDDEILGEFLEIQEIVGEFMINQNINL